MSGDTNSINTQRERERQRAKERERENVKKWHQWARRNETRSLCEASPQMFASAVLTDGYHANRISLSLTDFSNYFTRISGVGHQSTSEFVAEMTDFDNIITRDKQILAKRKYIWSYTARLLSSLKSWMVFVCCFVRFRTWRGLRGQHWASRSAVGGGRCGAWWAGGLFCLFTAAAAAAAGRSASELNGHGWPQTRCCYATFVWSTLFDRHLCLSSGEDFPPRNSVFLALFRMLKVGNEGHRSSHWFTLANF